MDIKNNPAGRLFDILTAARNQSARDSARNAWATVFEVDRKDTGTILKMLADLIDLTHETKESIKRLNDVDHALHLTPFGNIENMLSTVNLDGAWEPCKNLIDDMTLLGLRFNADKLSRASGFTHVADEDLVEIRKSLDELINKVVDSSLEADLKSLLLRNLESVRHALVSYRVRGIQGLQDEVEKSFGSMLLRKGDIAKSSEEHKEVWHSFYTLIDRVHKLVSLARDSKELAAPAVLALGQLMG